VRRLLKRRARRQAGGVVGYGQLVFIHHELRDRDGLGHIYAITETSNESAALGRAVREALIEQWPTVLPEWKGLIQPVLHRAGATSETRFVAGSTYASVSQDDDQYFVEPWKPTGNRGYVGVADGPRYQLMSPSDEQLGECILKALRDSAAFKRPSAR